MQTKSLSMRVKDADQGLVEAVFATLGVIDADGDVTVPGAFEDGAAVRISAYGHESWLGALPVGRGVIRADNRQAVLDGQFFLGTTHGRDTFETVKQMGDLQEWSYGFDVVKWSQGEFEGRDVRFLEGLKVHEVSPVLLGAGVDTRTLSVKAAGGITLVQEADQALAACAGLIARSKELASLRAKEGRVLSAANRERLTGLADAMREALVDVEALLAETDPDKDEGKAALRRELMRYVAAAHRL